MSLRCHGPDPSCHTHVVTTGHNCNQLACSSGAALTDFACVQSIWLPLHTAISASSILRDHISSRLHGSSRAARRGAALQHCCDCC